MTRWLLPLGAILALAGYIGPWINHQVAGLVITGLDLGEYVKFLPAVRDGTVVVWREGFYAPLVAISAAALFAAFRCEFRYSWALRIILLVIATVAALNLVPPAWTPSRLLEPEFRLQTTSLVLLLIGISCAPLLALLSHKIVAPLIIILGIIGIVAPLHGFLQVVPLISALYGQDQSPSWGPWLMTFGLIIILIPYARLLLPQRNYQAS